MESIFRIGKVSIDLWKLGKYGNGARLSNRWSGRKHNTSHDLTAIHTPEMREEGGNGTKTEEAR